VIGAGVFFMIAVGLAATAAFNTEAFYSVCSWWFNLLF
jgi:hypothetical protein